MRPENEPVREAARRMAEWNLGAVRDGQRVGMISVRDLLLHDLRQSDNEMEFLGAFIHSHPLSTPTGSER